MRADGTGCGPAPKKGVADGVAGTQPGRLRVAGRSQHNLTRRIGKAGSILAGRAPGGSVSIITLKGEAVANLKEATELYLEEFPLDDGQRPIITMFEVAAGAGAQYFAKMFEPVLRRANHRFPFANFRALLREALSPRVKSHAKPRSREIQFPGAENSR